MVILTCPNCSANMEIEEKRQFAFCQYCGTKIANIYNSVEINRSTEISNLLYRALEFEQKGDYKRAEEYCSRILDLDPMNESARALERRLPSAIPANNVLIVYQSFLKDKFKLRVTLDGRNWKELSNQGQLPLQLPIGKHRILFVGTKNYTYDIEIKDSNTMYTLIYTADRSRNTINCETTQYR